MRTILCSILCLLSLALQAQFSDAGFVANLTTVSSVGGVGGFTDTGYPTNISGKPSWLYYPVHNNYLYSSGIAKLTNLAPLTFPFSYNLTNKESGTAQKPTLSSASLNGFDTIHFYGAGSGGGTFTGCYLQCDSISMAQPIEIWMVVRQTNATDQAQAHFFEGTNGATSFNFYTIKASSNYDLFTGLHQTSPSGSWITNKWYILSFVVDHTGATTQIRTNGVSTGSSVNDFTKGMAGMVLSGRNTHDIYYYEGDFAELVVYTNLLSAAQRYSLSNYYVGKFSIPIP